MIDEKEFRKIFGKRLNYLRKKNGMTQSELADKLNYTDKAVSKWERGESIPDSYTVYKISNMFSVRMNYLFDENEVEDEKDKSSQEPMIERFKPLHVFIPLISTIGVFFIASIIYIIMINVNVLLPFSYFSFLYAVPIASIVLIVFSSMWWKLKYKCACVSALIWSLGFSVYQTFNNENLKFIFVTCAIMQVVCILVYVFVYFLERKKKNHHMKMSEEKEEIDKEEIDE